MTYLGLCHSPLSTAVEHEFPQSYHSLKHLITHKDIDGCLSPPRETFLFPAASAVGYLESNEIELKVKQLGAGV